MDTLDWNSVNRYLMHKQHLSQEAKTDDILQIAMALVGLHATAPTTPYLSLLARTGTFTKDQLEQELYAHSTLVRIKCFRRTIFMLPAALVPIAFSACRSLSLLTAKQYDRYLGMHKKEYDRRTESITSILKGRRLTASELKKELSVTKSLSGIINHMCDQGLIVRGKSKSGWKSNLHYYHLFKDLYPEIDLDAYEESEAIALLLKLYVGSYGPVTLTDIAWWSGLTKTVVRKHLDHLSDRIVPTKITGLDGDFLMTRDDLEDLSSFAPPEEDTINLLPLMDPYVMGYKDRARYLDTDRYHYVFDRSGNGTPTILLNGKIIGIWDASDSKNSVIKIFLFKMDMDPKTISQIAQQAEKMGRFLTEKDVQIRICDTMIPLHERTAGGFMTPLHDSIPTE